jgi:hypothetical protein
VEQKLESPRLLIDKPEEEIKGMAERTTKILKAYLIVVLISLIGAAITNAVNFYLLAILTLVLSIISQINLKYMGIVILIKRENKNKKR